ncbi:MAG: hypothetical protein EAZ27_01360 [Cytophagales bacterium]|nr:MAG: hypothetical protein EAZ27_01360 [Cytophagales bacterium]
MNTLSNFSDFALTRGEMKSVSGGGVPLLTGLAAAKAVEHVIKGLLTSRWPKPNPLQMKMVLVMAGAAQVAYSKT